MGAALSAGSSSAPPMATFDRHCTRLPVVSAEASDGQPPGGPRRLAALTASDRSLVSRSSLTLVSRVLSKATQLLWLVLAARLLSVDEFAQYGYVLSVALTFCVLGDAGVAPIVGREIASGAMSPAAAYWSALPLVGVIGAVVSVLFGLFLLLSSGPGVTLPSVLAGSVFILANRAFDLNGTSLRAIGRIEFDAVLQVSNAVLFLVLASGAALAGAGVATVLAALAVKDLASAVVAGVAIRPEVGPYRRMPFRGAVGLLRPGVIISAASFGLAVCVRAPLVVLGNVGTRSEVAYFAAAARFADTAILLSVTAGSGLMPGLAHIAASDSVRVRRLIRHGLLLLAAAGLLIAIPLVLFGGVIATTVFGANFGASARPLRILGAAMPVFAVTGLAWYSLLILRLERVILLGTVVGLAASVTLALELTRAHGSTGAALAYVGGVAALALVLITGVVLRLGSLGRRRSVSVTESAETSLL